MRRLSAAALCGQHTAQQAALRLSKRLTVAELVNGGQWSVATAICKVVKRCGGCPQQRYAGSIRRNKSALRLSKRRAVIELACELSTPAQSTSRKPITPGGEKCKIDKKEEVRTIFRTKRVMNEFWYYGKDAISGLETNEELRIEDIHILMERRVTELIQEVGIPAHIKGYNYLRTAILLVIDDPDLIHYMTTKLYGNVAEQYHTTASRVERAMRHALTCAWDKLYFGEAESHDWVAEYKPSNSEFIATLADKVRLEFRYISKPRYTELLKEHNK